MGVLPVAPGLQVLHCRAGLVVGAHPPSAVGSGREQWRWGRQVGRGWQGLGQPREQGQGRSLRLGGGQAWRRGGPVARQRVADTETFLFVGLEHVGEAEALATDIAGVRLLARVGAPVPLHVGTAGEALAADLADVRLLPWRMAVGSGVSLGGCYTPARGQPPCTGGTTVGFSPGTTGSSPPWGTLYQPH